MLKNKIIGSMGFLIAVTIAFSGCGKETNNINGEIPAWQVNNDKSVTLDWYVNYSWFVTGWGGNLVSDTITKETGIEVNLISPVGNEAEKLNALIASDSLPDIITLGWWEPQYSQIVENDMVYALNELADEYDPYFFKVADEGVMNWYTWPDGNVYCYPNSSYTPKDLEEHDDIPSNQTFLVRKDIYEAIGSPDMTTKEGFRNAVIKAKEMFPYVNGEPLIPIGAHVFDETGCVSFDDYLQNFLCVPWEKDGEFYDRNTDPEYIEWLKLFRELSEEGYLYPDIFVDSRTQMSEKIANGRYFCMLYQRTDLADQQKILYEKDKNSIYLAIDGPKNSNGDDHILPSTGITGWTVTMISKNCKYPDRAISLMTYLMSEHGQKMLCLGVEGEMYTEENGVITINEEVKNVLNTDRERYDLIYGADDTYWMLQNNVLQLKWRNEVVEPLKQLAEWTYPYTTYLGQYEILQPTDPGLSASYTNIEKLWGRTIKALLLAETEDKFDEIMAEYIEERNRLGFYDVIKEETRQMNENKAKLGLK